MKKKYIISIHGISANKTIWGSLGPALKAHLKDEYEIVHFPYEYRTGHDEYDTFDFAAGLNDFIASTIGTIEFSEGDTFDIIAHSQGGIIGMLWMISAFYNDDPILKHIDNFITLSAPFWGSKMAEFANGVRRIWDYTKRDFFLPAGKKELEEMGFGSDTVSFLRKALVLPQYQDFQKFLKERVTILNVGAFNGAFGNIEGDIAVTLPSARLDFYYNLLLNDYEDGAINPVSDMKYTDLGAYKIVEAVHHTYAPDMIQSIVQFPEACKTLNHHHPSFNVVLAQVRHAALPIIKGLHQHFKFLFIDINVRIEDMRDAKIEDIEITFSHLDDSPIPWNHLTFGWPVIKTPNLKEQFQKPFTELLDWNKFKIEWPKVQIPDYKKQSHVNHEEFRFNYQGALKIDTDNYIVKIKISMPGYKTRVIETLLKPTYTTYLDVLLLRK